MAIKFECKDLGSEGRCLRRYRNSKCEYMWQCNIRGSRCSTCRHKGTDVCKTCDIKTCLYNDG